MESELYICVYISMEWLKMTNIFENATDIVINNKKVQNITITGGGKFTITPLQQMNI